MIRTDLPLTRRELPFSTNGFGFDGVLCPSVHKGQVAHSTYLFAPENPCASSYRIDLKQTAENSRFLFHEAQKSLALSGDAMPYNLTESQWREYALAPHSYLALGNGVYQVGLNYFNRFLHLDTRSAQAFLLDPGVNDEFLSSTNWYDPEADELWFASWSALHTLQRNLDPLAPVTVTLWSYALRREKKKLIWRGNLGDSLHQLCLSPDGRFLVVAELGLRSLTPNELAPSTVLILDLQTLREWRMELPAAAHVEFDPEDPAVCYLSEHNIGLVGPKVGIFGPATLRKIRLTPDGPQTLGLFTHPDFHRITTHIVLKRHQQTLLALSGYPGHLFLLDAANLSLAKLITMDAADRVDLSNLPHLCTQDSYGIAASADGKHLLVCKTGRLEIYDSQTSRMIFAENIKDEGQASCFTGHLGLMTPSSGAIS